MNIPSLAVELLVSAVETVVLSVLQLSLQLMTRCSMNLKAFSVGKALAYAETFIGAA